MKSFSHTGAPLAHIRSEHARRGNGARCASSLLRDAGRVKPPQGRLLYVISSGAGRLLEPAMADGDSKLCKTKQDAKTAWNFLSGKCLLGANARWPRAT